MDNNNPETSYQEVAKGEFVLEPENLEDRDYVQVPDGEPFRAHISDIKKITSPNKFKNNELEEKLVVRFKLDEDIEGKGQVYTSWFRPSLNPKANLTKLVTALYGEIPNRVDVTDMIGMPLRVIFTKGVEKNEKVRQYVDSYLRPAKDQKKVIPEDDVLAQAVEAFGPGTEPAD